MNKEQILKAVLRDNDLKTKYWPSLNPDEHNMNTILKENNKFLKALHQILNDDNLNLTNGLKGKLKEVFNIN